MALAACSAGTQKKEKVRKRTRASYRNKQNPTDKAVKQADLALLEIAQALMLDLLKVPR